MVAKTRFSSLVKTETFWTYEIAKAWHVICVFFWPFLTNWSGGDHFWAPEAKNTRFWPFFHCFWPLFLGFWAVLDGPAQIYTYGLLDLALLAKPN
jgi:hypothetical protein